MKSLKRTIRDSRLKTHNVIHTWLKPKMGAIGSRYRLAARIRMANRWAARHPILLGDMMFAGMRAEMKEPNVNMIANVEPIFNGFRTIQANKETHRKTILDMTTKGQSIRHELDSMIAIPAKSHEDSIGIIRRYNQLENIVKSLKQNDND